MELFESGSEYKMKLDTIKDRVSAYMLDMLDEDELSSEEKELMNRWLHIWNLLNQYHTPSQAVETHLKVMASKGKEISRRTAYRDLRNATDLWGDASKISKRAQLILLYEFAVKTYRMAAKKKNYKEMNKALANLTKLAAMTEDHYDENREVHTYQLVIQSSKGQKTVNLDQVNRMKYDEFEEVVDAVEDDEMSIEEMQKLLEPKRDEDQPGV